MDAPEFPPVPSKVFSHLGPLQVAFELLEEDFGSVDLSTREVTLSVDQSAASSWRTYWHESVHVALWDAGVKLNEKVEENLCDVIGTYLAAAVRSGFLKVETK